MSFLVHSAEALADKAVSRYMAFYDVFIFDGKGRSGNRVVQFIEDTLEEIGSMLRILVGGYEKKGFIVKTGLLRCERVLLRHGNVVQSYLIQ